MRNEENIDHVVRGKRAKFILFVNSSSVMHCVIWYHLHNLKNVKNTYGGVLLSVKLQDKSLKLYY